MLEPEPAEQHHRRSPPNAAAPRAPGAIPATSVALALLLGALAGCSSASGIHPLDDSETRPESLSEARTEATAMLDRVEEVALGEVVVVEREWNDPSGCGTNQEDPDQGDVGLILFRSAAELPSGTAPEEVLGLTREFWESAGYSVGLPAPNMPDQVLTRVDGIGYKVVATPPGVELRAFLPCY